MVSKLKAMSGGTTREVERSSGWRQAEAEKNQNRYLPPTGDQRKITSESHSHENLCELPETTTFKYLDTTIDQERGCTAAEVTQPTGNVIP